MEPSSTIGVETVRLNLPPNPCDDTLDSTRASFTSTVDMYADSPTLITTYSNSPTLKNGISSSVATGNVCNQNQPPVAVAKSNPDKIAEPGSIVILIGKDRYDLDVNDFVSDYDWKITRPSQDIVKNAITAPTSQFASFKVPDYVPAEYTSSTTPPKLLPIDFSLSVADSHGLKSKETSDIGIDVKCNSQDQQAAEYARDFVNQIIDPSFILKVGSKAGYPQAIDNFGYWLHGRGDLEGLPLDVTGKGVAKPLNVGWLDSTSEFKKAQSTKMDQIQDEIRIQLKQMSNGQTQHFIPSVGVYENFITDKDKGYIGLPGAKLPTDFTVAVGSAIVQVVPDLTITKKTGGFTVSGTIHLRLLDIYDFNPVTFSVAGVGKVTSDQLHAAIKCLGARNFDQNTVYSKVLTNIQLK